MTSLNLWTLRQFIPSPPSFDPVSLAYILPFTVVAVCIALGYFAYICYDLGCFENTRLLGNLIKSLCVSMWESIFKQNTSSNAAREPESTYSSDLSTEDTFRATNPYAAPSSRGVIYQNDVTLPPIIPYGHWINGYNPMTIPYSTGVHHYAAAMHPNHQSHFVRLNVAPDYRSTLVWTMDLST